MNQVHILVVVEDEPDIRVLIRINLTLDPRLIVEGEASNAEDAIELARSTQPGLIILDHQLEGPMMGLDAAPLLKEAAPHAKILLFTAFDLEAEAEASPFVDAFLSKSKFANLLEVVHQMLGLEPLPAAH
ncbi:MAG TPA: response regulator [Actinomycetota bacterium]|nr:response regulator [Actinomycetota bacterium]